MLVRRIIVLSGALLLVGAAVGCSSSKGGAKTAVSVRTSISVQITPGAEAVPSVAATPIPAAAQTAVAAGASDPLVPYTDPNGRFTAKLPQGWDLQQQGNGVLAVLPGDPVAATIGITCAPGMTGGQLIQQDQNIADALHTGSFDETQPEGTQVAGISAERFEWVAHLGKTTQEHVSVYFDGHGCGWRLLLTTYTGTEIGTLRPLFDAVAASLTFS